MVLLVLVLLVLVLLVLVLLVLVLLVLLVFVLVFLVLILILLVLVLLLLLEFELGQAQVVAGLVVIRIAAQGVLIMLHGLVILLASEGDVAQVIVSLGLQVAAGCGFHQILQDAFGLSHGVVLVVALRRGAALSHQCRGQVKLAQARLRIGLDGFSIFHLGLGIALGVIQLVAAADVVPLFLHCGDLLARRRLRHPEQGGHNGDQAHNGFIVFLHFFRG